jgi:hypothetical protein
VSGEADELKSDVVENPFGPIDLSRLEDYKNYTLYFVATLKPQEVKRFDIQQAAGTYPVWNDCGNECEIRSPAYTINIKPNASSFWNITKDWSSFGVSPEFKYYLPSYGEG